MLVAFLGLINGTSPGTCLAKAGAAFLVFAGFGLILRFAATAADEAGDNASDTNQGLEGSLDMIIPGTSVADLLGVRSEEPSSGYHEDQEAA